MADAGDERKDIDRLIAEPAHQLRIEGEERTVVERDEAPERTTRQAPARLVRSPAKS
jgi:hypothetical protein